MIDRKNILTRFENLFGPADAKKIDLLINRFGVEKLDFILGYYEVNGLSGPKKGQRNNPYGLIYKVASTWNIKI